MLCNLLIVLLVVVSSIRVFSMATTDRRYKKGKPVESRKNPKLVSFQPHLSANSQHIPRIFKFQPLLLSLSCYSSHTVYSYL